MSRLPAGKKLYSRRRLALERLEARLMLSGSQVLEEFPSLPFLDPPITGVTSYGTVLAMDGNRAVVGIENGRSAYVLELTDGEWNVTAKLEPKQPPDEYLFGSAVAIDGDTIVIGATTFGTHLNSFGAAYVFSLEDGDWVESAVLRSNSAQHDGYFGMSVAIDGDTVAVGAPVEDAESSSPDAVYVFTEVAGAWQRTGQINPDATVSHFGQSLTIDEGRIVATGVFCEENTSEYQAVIFHNVDGDWVKVNTLSGTAVENATTFQSTVGLDGSTLVFASRLGDSMSMSSVLVFELEGGQWSEQQQLTTAYQATGDRYGASVAVNGDSIVVGAPGKVSADYGLGAAYLFQRDIGGDWVARERFTSLQPTQNFGFSVGISGDRILAGAPTSDGYQFPQGDVHQFQIVANDSDVGLIRFDYATPDEVLVDYALQGGLAEFDLRIFHSADDRFDAGDLSFPVVSQSIASGDAIDRFTFDPGAFDSARPYFVAIAVSLGEEHTLSNNVVALRQLVSLRPVEQFPRLLGESGALAFGGVGRAIDVDGRFAVIGEPLHDVRAADAGVVYVYEKTGELWKYRQAVFAPDAKQGDRFGISVAVEGNTIVIGASGDDERGTDAGAAFIFRFSGETWTYDAKLTASNPKVGAAFGSDVAMNGETLVVAAAGGTYEDSASVFERHQDNWVEARVLRLPDESFANDSARKVEIDGETVIVLSLAGVHEFARVDGEWIWRDYVTNSVGALNGSIAIDQGIVVVGTSWETRNSGYVQLFERIGSHWYQTQYLQPNSGEGYGQFAAAVAIQGDTLVVGAPDLNGDGGTSGLVYIFRRSGDGDWIENMPLSTLDGKLRDGFGAAAVISGNEVFIGAPQKDSSLLADAGGVHVLQLTCTGNDVAVASLQTVAAGKIRINYALQGAATQFQLSIYRSADKLLDVADLTHLVQSQEVVDRNGLDFLELDIATFDAERPYLIAVVTTDVNESNSENNQAVLTSPLLPGDYNLDGRVDAADYSVWRNTMGQTGLVPYSGADGTGNGSVGPEDHAVWKLHFGESIEQGAGSLEMGVKREDPHPGPLPDGEGENEPHPLTALPLPHPLDSSRPLPEGEAGGEVLVATRLDEMAFIGVEAGTKFGAVGFGELDRNGVSPFRWRAASAIDDVRRVNENALLAWCANREGARAVRDEFCLGDSESADISDVDAVFERLAEGMPTLSSR